MGEFKLLVYLMSDQLLLKQNELVNRLESLVKSDKSIAVACSGGKDSMALVEIFLKMRSQVDSFDFTVMHINYQLRGEQSNLDEKFVKDFCASHNLTFLCKRVEGFKLSSNIQNWARDVRYNWFSEWTSQNNGVVAIAHHRDDVCETAIFKLARGSELDRLSGMDVFQEDSSIWRPLLKFSHQEIVTLVDGKKIPHREDESNATIKYSRNRIRLNVLPELEMVSSGASQKIFEAAKEITDLYEYVLDVHRDLIFADQIDFASLGNMPKSLAKLIIIKFNESKDKWIQTKEDFSRCFIRGTFTW